jgi:hypothetical protein
VAKRIRMLHSYEVPEVIVLPIVSGAADYLAWIAAETGAAEPIAAERTAADRVGSKLRSTRPAGKRRRR